MLDKIIVWIYLINATLLITHEVESGYWKEWNLFSKNIKNEKKALNGFLIFHIIIIPIVLYGLLELSNKTAIGLFISLFLAFSGIFAFIFHMVFIYKGRPEFTFFISKFILTAILIVSTTQMIISILLF